MMAARNIILMPIAQITSSPIYGLNISPPLFQQMRKMVSSRMININPRLIKNPESFFFDCVFFCIRKEDVPTSRINTGAQKCVTHRVKNKAGVVLERFSGLKPLLLNRKTLAWSIAISTITIPRKKSIDCILPALLTALMEGAGIEVVMRSLLLLKMQETWRNKKDL
jgi:hypothetical protein